MAGLDMDKDRLPVPWWCLEHQKILKYSLKSVSSGIDNTSLPRRHSKYEWGSITKEKATVILRQLLRTIPTQEDEENEEMVSHLMDLLQQFFALDVDNVSAAILALCGTPRLTWEAICTFSHFEELVFVVEHMSAKGCLPKKDFYTSEELFRLAFKSKLSVVSLLLFHGVPCEAFNSFDKEFRHHRDVRNVKDPRFQTATFFTLLYRFFCSETVSFSLATIPGYTPTTTREMEEFLHLWRLCDPQPLITPHELRTILQKSHSRDEESDRFCEIYANSFRTMQVGEKPEPHRLLHLCRCVIRRRLFDNDRLIFGVESLKIPETLKGYLMLRSEEEWF